jgi:AraC-like DNA-binding protein
MPSKNEIDTEAAVLADLQSQLSAVIAGHTTGEEDRVTPIRNLTFFRREHPGEPRPCLVEPSVVVVAQGAKQLLIGERAHSYDAQRFLITSLEIPGNSKVIEASSDRPCLGLTLRLDLRIISELVGQVRMPAPRERTIEGSVGIGTMTSTLLAPFGRLLALLDEPEPIAVLAPLIEREIHYRLLTSDIAPRLLQIVSVGSQSHRISRAIDWLKTNYAQPLRVEELAAHAQMSTSTLHHHFRDLTAMSPLQYQKWLRLNEARRLMLNEHLDAANAAFNVGYESPSQFSREYSRLFGAPPKRDIEGMRSRIGKAAPRLERV